MPTSSVGKTKLRPKAGVTLIEMLVVVALISLMVGISFPAITSGIDSLRLNAATNGVVSFLNCGLEPRRTAPAGGGDHDFQSGQFASRCDPAEPGFYRKLQLPDGVSITHVLPELPDDPDHPREPSCCIRVAPRRRFGVQLINRRNVERIVRVDPITGVPRVEAPTQ